MGSEGPRNQTWKGLNKLRGARTGSEDRDLGRNAAKNCHKKIRDMDVFANKFDLPQNPGKAILAVFLGLQPSAATEELFGPWSQNK